MTDKDTDKKAQKPAAEAKVAKSTEKKSPSKTSSAASAKPVSEKKPAAKKPVVKNTAAELDKANSAIKSKKSAADLKDRAAAAKMRAQEKILDKSYVSDPPMDPLERLADTFDHSARRWEMVVYPSLFAFVLLAGYGFFLIYRLTHDISTLSHSVTRMAVIVSDAMPRMTKDLGAMTGSMDNMTTNISGMSTDVKDMTGEIGSMSNQMNTLTPLSQNISNMTGTMNEMNRSVYGMQRDMGGMNRTISSGPFGMMNDFMPFSSKTNVAPQLPPPTYRQPWETQRYNAQRPPAPKVRTPKATVIAKPKGVVSKPTAKNNSVKPADKIKKVPATKPVMHGSSLTNSRIVASTTNASGNIK